jgi:cell division protein FtsQ
MLPQKLLWGRIVRGGVLLGLAGLAALGVVSVARWVEGSDTLPVRTVAVHGNGLEAGSPRVDEILAYAAVQPGSPLFALDLDAVKNRVLEHPYVASATVRRVPPDGVEITVETRQPAAILAAGSLYLVDVNGQVMKTARNGDGLDMPVITGIAADDVASGDALPTLHAAVDLLHEHARAGSPGGTASEVHLIPGVGFELVLEDGTRVRVGDDEPEVMKAKLARLDAVVRRLSLEGRRASFIYLDDERRPERAAVRLRPGTETPPVGG